MFVSVAGADNLYDISSVKWFTWFLKRQTPQQVPILSWVETSTDERFRNMSFHRYIYLSRTGLFCNICSKSILMLAYLFIRTQIFNEKLCFESASRNTALLLKQSYALLKKSSCCPRKENSMTNYTLMINDCTLPKKREWYINSFTQRMCAFLQMRSFSSRYC